MDPVTPAAARTRDIQNRMVVHAATQLRPYAEADQQAKVVRLPVSSPSNQLSDADLVERSRSGDLGAFDQLVDRHVDAAYATAFALLANPADAEDVCQDAFITALERLDQCRDGARFRPWLLQIVRNRAHNLRRYYGVRSEVNITDISPVRSASNPSLDAERAELRGQLTIALLKLTDLQRQVVVLFDMEGWNHHDISETLDISEGASRAALFKGRTALRQLLASLRNRLDK